MSWVAGIAGRLRRFTEPPHTVPVRLADGTLSHHASWPRLHVGWRLRGRQRTLKDWTSQYGSAGARVLAREVRPEDDAALDAIEAEIAEAERKLGELRRGYQDALERAAALGRSDVPSRSSWSETP